jgi:hypothetical protein
VKEGKTSISKWCSIVTLGNPTGVDKTNEKQNEKLVCMVAGLESGDGCPHPYSSVILSHHFITMHTHGLLKHWKVAALDGFGSASIWLNAKVCAGAAGSTLSILTKSKSRKISSKSMHSGRWQSRSAEGSG